MSEESSSSNGIGVFGALGIVFIVLKLTHYISWSWWWVLAPFWGPLAVVVGFMALLGIVWLIRNACKDRR